MQLLEEAQEQQLHDLQTLEHEVSVADQRVKLELLKKKLNDLEKEADAATQVTLFTRLTVSLSSHTSNSVIKPHCKVWLNAIALLTAYFC